MPTAMMAIGIAASNTCPTLQAEKCRRGGEDDGHDMPHRDRIGRHLAGDDEAGMMARVLFARFEFPVSVSAAM